MLKVKKIAKPFALHLTNEPLGDYFVFLNVIKGVPPKDPIEPAKEDHGADKITFSR